MSFIRSIFNVGRNITSQILTKRAFHLLQKPTLNVSSMENALKPVRVSIVPSCGLKVRGMLHRRCKDCYFVRREEIWYVMCKTHPRHKQVQMKAHERKSWILSHATQGKIRPW